jgi:tRNA pseudouridine55 synthase
MDGALVIDKPAGITSHDVVAATRRILHEPRIGHAGTLDPLATGVLVLVCGRATRLARFLSASDKTYEAGIRFGLTTDTYDVTGTVLTRSERRPTRCDVDDAVAKLRGEYLQQPPAFSARKVDGTRAYALARRQKPVTLEPSQVRVSRADVVTFEEDGRVAVTLTCSAGFYVRSFAQTLGELVGCGACLETLRRTASGDFAVEDAVSLTALQESAAPGSLLMPVERLLPRMASVRVTDEGVIRVSHGRVLESRHFFPTDPGLEEAVDRPSEQDTPRRWVRILRPDGRLIAIGQLARRGSETNGGADAASHTLHPSVVMI